MYKHLMLPTDGSELSERAAREGVRFAKSIGARLTALHTTPVFYPFELHAHSAAERALEYEQFWKRKQRGRSNQSNGWRASLTSHAVRKIYGMQRH